MYRIINFRISATYDFVLARGTGAALEIFEMKKLLNPMSGRNASH
jgi:hypothetical protein